MGFAKKGWSIAGALASLPRVEELRIVIKLGTGVLTLDSGEIARNRLKGLLEAVLRLVEEGHEVLIVTSGAVGLGRKSLGLPLQLSLHDKQACAAIGQSMLMQTYQTLLQEIGCRAQVAQVLLTADDLADRARYLNLRHTLERLLGYRVLPILNENDCVSVREITELHESPGFGDNDSLSAIVAAKMDADLLLLLTDVDAVYTANPKRDPAARKIGLIRDFAEVAAVATRGRSAVGQGGMNSKLMAARIASLCGCATVIASGFEERIIDRCLQRCIDARQGTACGEDGVGTLVLPRAMAPLSKRAQWIGLASGHQGILTINRGAARALVMQDASLLPIGVLDVQGRFRAGQVVSIHDEDGREIGRGLCEFSSEEMLKYQGKHSSAVLALDRNASKVAIHKDNLVVFLSPESEAGGASPS